MDGWMDGWMCDMEEGQIPHGLTGFSVCLAFRAQAPSAPTSHQKMPSTKISHQSGDGILDSIGGISMVPGALIVFAASATIAIKQNPSRRTLGWLERG